MIRYERAGAAHVPGVMRVMALAFDGRFGEGWSAAQVTAALESAERAGEVALGADGVVVGFSLARCAADEAELLLVAVDPAWRRRGVAAALVTRVLDGARAGGARAIFLEVRDANHGAGALYRAQGFQAVGRRKGYYAGADQRRHDAITMRRTL